MKPSLLAAHHRLAQIVTFLSHPTKLISTISKHHELAPHIMNRTVLLVGANRGIGLNLARALAANSWNVIGSVRPQTRADNDPSIKEIEAVASRVLEINLTDESTIAKAAEEFGEGPLDMLITLAGIGPEPDNWWEHTAKILTDKFTTNTVGPFLTSKYFYHNLKKASGTIINISSNAGSISMCKGEDMAYRMSKAALNMMTVTMAKEFQMNNDNITVLAVNPGYVATRLTNFRSRDDMDECIAGIVKVLENVSMEQTGTFLDWRGQTLPW
ncbi:uncharacterized oxidoreductase YKL071W [Trichoderma asperellum]|uniref:Uncharacterized oxidoreductase YKL071W n=1 Tax=Trichoderma asperellum TaxID=101201 RepID=A0A6V8QHI7_TRIAP|nr:uncharacterized oxidoreductase YKL071W [Trichoderma asperellum]